MYKFILYSSRAIFNFIASNEAANLNADIPRDLMMVNEGFHGSHYESALFFISNFDY